MPPLESLPVEVPEVWLPAAGVDLGRWAVIACDQYTSQREYWRDLEGHVGSAPSALHLILPEVYLADGDADRRIAAIHASMREYVARGVVTARERGFVVVERETARGARRQGLVIALDLAQYDFRDASRTPVRATERTVEERLPARVRVREGALLELPHVLVLVDDPEHSLIAPILERAARRAPLYDTPLWPGAGRVRGWLAGGAGEVAHVARVLRALGAPERFRRLYAIESEDVLLFAVGDGNHSLAAARLVWERLRERLGEAAAAQHPARWALVELVNVHDPGLCFEPIHRMVFAVDAVALLASLPGWLAAHGARGRIERIDDPAQLEARLGTRGTGRVPLCSIGWIAAGHGGLIEIEDPAARLPVERLQAFLDDWVEKHPESSIDYIHGSAAVRSLAAVPGRMGFFLPALDRAALFPHVIARGALPRKSFSLGEADEKRFYLEARRILPPG